AASSGGSVCWILNRSPWASSSVETDQGRFDLDGLAQGPVEGPAAGRALEARQAAAGVGAPPRAVVARDQPALAGDEPEELGLRRLPTAADTAPDRCRQAAGVPSSFGPPSIGTLARTCSGGAYCGWTVSRSRSPSDAAA